MKQPLEVSPQEALEIFKNTRHLPDNERPVFLYMKKHNITGLLYFGRTIKEPFKYKGSGLAWSRHIKEYGNDISTIWLRMFETEDDLRLFKMARRISLQLDIVNSDRFANKVIESGHNKAKELPSWEYLNECFEYNEDTGELFWKERPLHHFKDTRCMNSWNVKFSKNRSGYVSKNTGYLLTGINDITFLNHRIIWKLLKKEEPPAIVDHIDNNSLNNRICNLRKASKSQNIRNRGKNKNNTTGFKGVQFSKKYKKFIAAIEYDGKLFHLGTFQTAEEASLAYQEKSIAIYKEFASISQAEYEENLKNTKISDKIRKGKGYWYNKVTNNYESYIQHNKKRIHLGTFDSVEDALYAYNQACLDLSGEFANTPVEEYREKIKKAKKAKQIC